MKICMRDKLNEISSKYCKTCVDSCCSAVKHYIYVKDDELQPFIDEGIPVYDFSDMDIPDYCIDGPTPASVYRYKRGTEDSVDVPSLIQASPGSKNYFIMSNGLCPMKDEGGCKIYDRRPNTCSSAPFKITEKNGITNVGISNFCHLRNDEDFRNEVKSTISEIVLE